MRTAFHKPLFSLRSRRAFTLLEMLVAMVIFGLVIGSVYTTWRILMQGNASALQMAARAQRKRLAVQTIEEALSSAVFFAVNATNYSFFGGSMGPFAELSFVANLGTSFPGSGRFEGERVRRLWFSVEPGPGGTADLVMRQNSMLAPMDDLLIAFPIVLAKDVGMFQLEFWDPQLQAFDIEWLRTNELPAMVRVSLVLGQESPTGTAPPDLVSRLVRLPAVGVAGDAQVGPGPASMAQ